MSSMEIDDIYYRWSYNESKYYISVKDLRNPKFKAELIMSDNGMLHVGESSFTDDARRKQMLSYAEKNKQFFKRQIWGQK